MRHDLAQQPKPLGRKLVVQSTNSGSVAARTIEAAHEPCCNKVTGPAKYDWDVGGRSFGRERRRLARHCNNHGHLTLDQLGRQLRQPMGLSVRPARFDRQAFALDEAALGQTFTEPR